MSLAVRWMSCFMLAIAGGLPLAGTALGLTPVMNPAGDERQFADEANAAVLEMLQVEPRDEYIVAIPGLVEAFPNAHETMQHAILRIFSQLLDVANPTDRAAMVETAKGALASPFEPVRVEALDVLGRTGDDTVVALAIPMLSDPDWEVRVQALYVLAPFAEAGEHPEIFPAVSALADDEDGSLRAAAQSLMRFAPSGQ